MQPPPLERLAGRYSLDRQIGEGGMGAVYVALDEKTKRRVAVKILIIEEDEKLHARFEQEARATMELAHPNIVRVTDFHAEPGKAPFLVMELLEGESLRDRIKRERRLPVEDAVRIAIELCEALAAAHAAGVIHRDVKPPNVFLVKPSGRAKLLDFGIAKVRAEFGKVHTTTGTVLGTPSYFAPEQLLAKEIDGRTDVHAVGIVLYEMLCGRRPFMEENPVDLTAAILHAAPPPIEKLRPEIPKELAAAVHDALAKDRFSRPTASELAKRLAPFGPRRSRLAPMFVVALIGAAAAGTFAYATASDAPTVAPVKSEPVVEASVTDGPAISANAGADAAALLEEARDASYGGYKTLTRDLLKRAVDAGASDDSTLDWLAVLCAEANDVECPASARARAGDGHLRDADGRSSGGGP